MCAVGGEGVAARVAGPGQTSGGPAAVLPRRDVSGALRYLTAATWRRLPGHLGTSGPGQDRMSHRGLY